MGSQRLPVRRTYLEVSVDHEAVVHVLQAQDDLSGVEAHLLLAEDAVLRQVVVQVAAWNTDTVSDLITDPPPEGLARLESPDWPASPRGRGHSPFMRSRMKQSLSGVWKA